MTETRSERSASRVPWLAVLVALASCSSDDKLEVLAVVEGEAIDLQVDDRGLAWIDDMPGQGYKVVYLPHGGKPTVLGELPGNARDLELGSSHVYWAEGKRILRAIRNRAGYEQILDKEETPDVIHGLALHDGYLYWGTWNRVERMAEAGGEVREVWRHPSEIDGEAVSQPVLWKLISTPDQVVVAAIDPETMVTIWSLQPDGSARLLAKSSGLFQNLVVGADRILWLMLEGRDRDHLDFRTYAAPLAGGTATPLDAVRGKPLFADGDAVYWSDSRGTQRTDPAGTKRVGPEAWALRRAGRRLYGEFPVEGPGCRIAILGGN